MSSQLEDVVGSNPYETPASQLSSPQEFLYYDSNMSEDELVQARKSLFREESRNFLQYGFLCPAIAVGLNVAYKSIEIPKDYQLLSELPTNILTLGAIGLSWTIKILYDAGIHQKASELGRISELQRKR